MKIRGWAPSIHQRIVAALQDRARLVDAIILGVVCVYALVCTKYEKVNFWKYLVEDEATYRDLAAGLTTSAALVAGFAGVVVIFALQNTSPRFRTLRVRGGSSLRSTWTSVTASGFLALGTGFLSIAFFGGKLAQLGPWFLTFGVLVLIHSSLRLLWMIDVLAGAVDGDDADAIKADRVLRTADMPFLKNRKQDLRL